MKTYKNLFQKVTSLRNLYNAFKKAKKGKSNSKEVLEFEYYLEENLILLQKELQAQTYKTGKYRHFIIFEPKERKISALPFKDRIVHHAICSIIEPIFEKTFIHDSYACRKKKGTHAGIKQTQKFIRNPKNSYVLKCDVSKYFSNVNHSQLKRVLRKKIDDKKLLNLLDKIIDSAPSEKGIPIGNLTSQLFANIYLDQLDEQIKYKMKIKNYIRYMDDFIILHQSKRELHKIKEQIKISLGSIKLTLHPKKANITPLNLGIDFLGYKIHPTHKLARKSTIKRFIKNSGKKIQDYNLHEINFEKLLESFNSWNAYLNHANTHNLKKSLRNKYFKNLA